MLLNPAVLLFAPESVGMTRGEKLSACGFDCQYFRDLLALYAEVQSVSDAQDIAVVLTGTSAENRHAVFYLRTMRARLGLVVQLQTGSEEEQMGLIQAGVDWMYPVGASCELVATMLLSLWHRPVPAPEQPSQISAAARRCGDWALTEHAWILEDPKGSRVSLTSSERALLITLFDAPELSATHKALMTAINQARDLPPDTGPRTRLGVLVSRLRSKCHRHDMDLPIRVMHNMGYMFAAQADTLLPDKAPSSAPTLVSVGTG